MGVRFRDDVMASFRLAVRTEWWVAVDLLAGLAGYTVWVAGSAALGLQLASLADYPVAPGGTPTTPVLALVGFLWLVLPAAAGAARVRSRLLNIRGNVEQDYRFDRPAALLVPPAVLVALVAGAGVAMGAVDPLLFVVLAPATLYLLVRTIAYSYRVYAGSRPMVLYAGLFAALAIQAGVLVLYLGLTTENTTVVEGAIEALGLPLDPLARTTVGPLAAPTGLLVAVAVPVGVAVAYVAAQSLAALAVRVRDPTVRPSRVRTGQRYPPWLDVASNGGRSSSTKSAGTDSGSAAEAADADGAAGVDSEDGSPTSDSPAAAASTADASGSGGDSMASDTTDSGESTAAADADADAADEEAVSHTRVFTPGDADGDPLSSTTDDDRDCPACGATIPSDADECPACGAGAL